MTPQCFQNDLAGSVIDARDVCCVVVGASGAQGRILVAR
jgi:ERCC4-related helicase